MKLREIGLRIEGEKVIQGLILFCCFVLFFMKFVNEASRRLI